MKVVVVVAVARLYKDAAITETLGEHFTSYVVQVYTWWWWRWGWVRMGIRGDYNIHTLDLGALLKLF